MSLQLQEVAEGVAVLTLNHPPVNAFNWPVKQQLLQLLQGLSQRPEIRALVIRSELPRSFSVGSDIFELQGYVGREGEGAARAWREHEMLMALAELPAVTIAAVEGYALGGGLEDILACDFRIAGANARFGFPEVKLGGAPGILSLALLPWLVGPSKAKELLLFGEHLSAEEAERIGLVNLVVPAGEVEATALAWARKVVALPPLSVRSLKQMVNAGLRTTIESVSGEVISGTERLFQTGDMREGVNAFIEKRTPRFQGR